MSNELKTILADVLKEALTPINNEIKKLNDKVDNIEINMVTKQEFDNRLDQFDKSANENFNKLSDKFDGHHYENINSAHLLLNEIRSMKGP